MPFSKKQVPTAEPAFPPRERAHAPLLVEMLGMSEEEFREKFKGSPVKRAKWRGLMRNVAAALASSDDFVAEAAPVQGLGLP